MDIETGAQTLELQQKVVVDVQVSASMLPREEKVIGSIKVKWQITN